jgi:hypothetical protein
MGLAMSDLEIGKREVERDHLSLFLEAYQLATGESFPEMYDSETLDFIGRDKMGRVVGIEITQLRFGPDERHIRRIDPLSPTTRMRGGGYCNCASEGSKVAEGALA